MVLCLLNQQQISLIVVIKTVFILKYLNKDMDLKEIVTFLQERNVNDNHIRFIENEKLDSTVIVSMSEQELSNFLPAYGDRIALKMFCEKRTGKIENMNKRKQSLLETLRAKVGMKTKNKDTTEDVTKEKQAKRIFQNHGNKKDTRKIELGWLCSLKGGNYKQVRTKGGGGTRDISVPRIATKEHLIKEALKLFFPDNISSHGHIDKFDIDLLDFKRNIVDNFKTVDDILCETRLKNLRFYLATKEKTSSKSFLQQYSQKSPGASTSSTITSHNIHTNSLATTLEQNEIETEPLSPVLTSKSSKYYISSDDSDDLSITHMDANDLDIGNEVEIENIIERENEINLLDVQRHDNDLLTVEEDDFFSDVELRNEEINILYIHRGHAFSELIDSFNRYKHDSPLKIKMIAANGIEEKGEDYGGVFRDVLSEFWQTFYDKCTVGTEAKVPFIRHDFDAAKWQTIAAILYRGWKDVKYFPVEISQIFMETVILNDVKSDIKEAFLKVLCKSDRDIIKEALNNFANVESDELLDVLTSLESKILPTKDNFEQLITDISHKELIQKPKFIIDNWSEVLKNIMDEKNLNQIYKNCRVNTKSVLSLLSFKKDLSAEKEQTLNFLKHFIKEAETNMLKSFIRFCTGADMIVNKKIEIEFKKSEHSKENNFARAPTAHTCGCVLVLPTDYDNYPEFKSEFNTLLSSNVWVMDGI